MYTYAVHVYSLDVQFLCSGAVHSFDERLLIKLTKYPHATVLIEEAGQRFLIDPGTFTPTSAELLATTTAVLITHDHFDHFDVDTIGTALEERADLRLWGPSSVVAALEGTVASREGRIVVVRPGDAHDVSGVNVRVFGGDHAQIHDGITVPHNVGYLVGDRVFHPGDSYLVPDVRDDTLPVPVSGPWVSVGDAIDFINAVGPRLTIQIHDIMLSDIGRASTAKFLGENGLTKIPMLVLAADESTEL